MKQPLEPGQQKLAEIFARLASIKNLADLRPGDRLNLDEDLRDTFRYWFAPQLSPEDRAAMQYPNLTETMHRYCYDIIGGLLDGQCIEIKEFTPPRAQLSLIDGKHLRHQYKPEQGPGVLFAEFLYLIIQREFPFKRCPGCSIVFVPHHKQRYCSHNCAMNLARENYKEKKAAYMKSYMAKRRKHPTRGRPKSLH